MIASVVGVTSAAPRPCTARLATSTSALPASPATSDAAVKMPSPIRNSRRRPKTSAEPATGEQQAGEHQDVAADHPLQAGRGQVQVALDRRDRDVDDVVVEVGHEGGQCDRDQGPGPAGDVHQGLLYGVHLRCIANLYGV